MVEALKGDQHPHQTGVSVSDGPVIIESGHPVDVNVAWMASWYYELLLWASYSYAGSGLSGHLKLHFYIIFAMILEVQVVERSFPKFHRAVVGDGDHLVVRYFNYLVDSWLVLLNALNLLQVELFIVLNR